MSSQNQGVTTDKQTNSDLLPSLVFVPSLLTQNQIQLAFTSSPTEQRLRALRASVSVETLTKLFSEHPASIISGRGESFQIYEMLVQSILLQLEALGTSI